MKGRWGQRAGSFGCAALCGASSEADGTRRIRRASMDGWDGCGSHSDVLLLLAALKEILIEESSSDDRRSSSWELGLSISG